MLEWWDPLIGTFFQDRSLLAGQGGTSQFTSTPTEKERKKEREGKWGGERGTLTNKERGERKRESDTH